MKKHLLRSRLLVPCVLALLPTVVLAQAPRSVVGTWHLPGYGCKRDDSALTIKPMALEGEHVSCKFTSVKRSGNTVEWSGICDGAEGASRERVTATETAKGLTIRYFPGGNVIEGLQRCPK